MYSLAYIVIIIYRFMNNLFLPEVEHYDHDHRLYNCNVYPI